MTNGLRWMHSIADPKQHAQTLDNVLGASEHNGRQAGAVPVMEPAPRVGASPTIHGNGRPPVVPDGPPRRYGGGGILQKCGVSERRGKGEGVMSWLPSAAKESRLRTAGGGWRVGWKTSLVAVPRYSAFRSEGTKPIRPEGGAHAGIVEDHRPRLGSRPGPGGRPEGLRRTPPGVVQGKAAVRRVRRARRIGVGGGVRAGHAAVVVRRGTVRHVRSSGGDGRGPAVSAGGERIEGGARVQPQPRLARTVRPRRGQRPVHADEGFRLRQEIPLHA